MSTFLLIAPVLLFSVVLHEVAHAWVASTQGDDTARRQGRITLNPISHIDPVGTVLVPLALYFLGSGTLFGWARPVPVDPRNYRDFKRGDILVSLAGIVANLGLAVVFSVALIAVGRSGVSGSGAELIGQVSLYGLYINLILAFFNLIPIPPLDGSHVVYHLLPPSVGIKYQQVGRYGVALVFLLLMAVPDAFRILLWPVQWIVGLVTGAMGP